MRSDMYTDSICQKIRAGHAAREGALISPRQEARRKAAGRCHLLLAIALSTVISTAAHAQFIASVAALRVEAPNGKRSWMFGSVHVSSSILREPTSSALGGSRVLVTEHEMGKPDPDEAAAHGAPAPWAQDLTDEELQTYLARATCANQSKAAALEALTYRSVQTANQIAYTVCGSGAATQTRDAYFNGIAVRLRHETLEDWNWVEQQRHKLPAEDGALALHWILQREPGPLIAEIAQALNGGDYERISNLTQASAGGSGPAGRSYELMVRQRNEAWMPRLKKLLSEGDAIVVVGAMHLPGADGLVARLIEAGFAVRPVMLPAVQ